MWTLFLYTGHGLDNFRANTPDNIVVFASGSHETARKSFIKKIGKEPELMGFQNVEGSSKEIAWQKALDANLGLDDVEFDMAMAFEGTLVIDDKESSRESMRNLI